MSNVFLTADLHLGHEKTCTVFEGHDGRPLRPFVNADEMDQTIIKNFQARLTKNDTLYVLGDVCIDPKNLWKLHEIPGRKTLIPGNHERLPMSRYLEFFDDVEVYKVFKTSGLYKRFVCSHVPMHPDSVTRWGANVHGHLHSDYVRLRPGHTDPDPRYLCVSLEQTNYAPLHLDEVRARLEDGPKALASAFSRT